MIGVCGIGEGEEGEGEKEKGGEKGKRKVENQYGIKKRNREEEKTERRSEVEVEVRVEAKLGMLIHSCDARKSRISFSSTTEEFGRYRQTGLGSALALSSPGFFLLSDPTIECMIYRSRLLFV